jgi:hypothetical protein
LQNRHGRASFGGRSHDACVNAEPEYANGKKNANVSHGYRLIIEPEPERPLLIMGYARYWAIDRSPAKPMPVVFTRLLAFTIALIVIFPSPASAVREKYYRVGFIGLPPLAVTSKGFTDGALCATFENTGTQPVVEMVLSATYDDVRVKPGVSDIKRRIDPGMTSKFNCVQFSPSWNTNAVFGRVEKVILADGTVAVAPVLPPRPAPAPGTMTAADGTATVAPMPIDMSVCQAVLSQYDLSSFFGALDVTYKNLSDAAIVRLDLQLVLGSGIHTFSDVGSFGAGETITHRIRPTPAIGKDEVRTAFVICQVTKIQLADGRVWTP